MSADCTRIRDDLTRGRIDSATPHVAQHLRGCAGCARYARRLNDARRALREHHTPLVPDGAFVARVREQLDPPAFDLMGRAALRVLPASLALLVALSWATATFVEFADGTVVASNDELTELSSNDEQDEPFDELFSWLLDGAESAQ